VVLLTEYNTGKRASSTIVGFGDELEVAEGA